MLNTRNEETNPVCYSNVACFVKQSTGRTHTGHTDREYLHPTYVRFHVIYRVNQAEYVVHIRVVGFGLTRDPLLGFNLYPLTPIDPPCPSCVELDSPPTPHPGLTRNT